MVTTTDPVLVDRAAAYDFLSPHFELPVLIKEVSWRSIAASMDHRGDRINIAYWKDETHVERRYSAPTQSSHYIIEVLLRATTITCSKNGRNLRNGPVAFGATQVTAPEDQLEASFTRSAEAIHVFVPRSVVASVHLQLHGKAAAPDYRLVDPGFAADTMMGKLACMLLETEALRNPYAHAFSNSLAMAILTRAMENGSQLDDKPRQALPPWWLERTIAYMESRLGERVTLSDIADLAGLSRMHFASQFKRLTGLSPHTYLTVMRLETAKGLLAENRMPIAQIAISVGFNSQAHFTTVFRKVTGMTPQRWRLSAASAAQVEAP
ncbi:AraC family transcriptional regulator [Caballeronia sp. INML2]|jgi:AraC-like DNA-binding protein|uniref:helix-turn-helix domain-containing protein n=1 Tax=Caballeronia sp. INML2 TaxID=2921748 RepID=UPI002027A008|nr:AraC family transcriptional regulator [Caballeronia sp. INML2]